MVDNNNTIPKLNIKASPADFRDFDYKITESVPDIFDIRNDLKDVRNQGNQGSCFAFSAACMKVYQEFKDYKNTEYMSPQFFYDNRFNLYDDISDNDEGMYGRDVMKLLLKQWQLKVLC